MTTATVSLHAGSESPSATVLTTSEGARFVIFSVGGVQIFIPGFDADNVAAARALAATLTAVADELETALAARAPIEPPPPPPPEIADDEAL
jgi:UDP-N-acetylmuramyl pentapeptide synthase